MADQTSPPLPPRDPLIHNAALFGAIVTPLAMLLPPRKFDIRFLVLSGAFSLSTNQLAYEYTGQSIYSRFQQRMGSLANTGLPEGAQRTQRILREQKERDAAQKAAAAAEHDKNQQGTLSQKVKETWMGGEGENWKEKRAEEHKKSMEEGKGISGIMLEQIGEVWSSSFGKSSKKGEASSNQADADGRPPKK